jgi:hypothetical protein
MFMKDHRERNIRPSQKTHPNGTEIAKEARFRFPRTIQLLSPAQVTLLYPVVAVADTHTLLGKRLVALRRTRRVAVARPSSWNFPYRFHSDAP